VLADFLTEVEKSEGIRGHYGGTKEVLPDDDIESAAQPCVMRAQKGTRRVISGSAVALSNATSSSYSKASIENQPMPRGDLSWR